MTKRDKPTQSRKPSRKSAEKPPEFVPSPIEQRLLDSLLNPEHRMSSVTRICEVSGISRQTYYETMKRKDFMDYYRQSLFQVIKEKSGQLIHIAVREANKGSFQHLKLLMEMGGFYNEKTTVVSEGEQTITIRFADPEMEPFGDAEE